MECCHREEDTTHESEPKSSRLRRRRRPQDGRKQIGRNLHDSAHHGKSKCIPRVHTSWDARSVPPRRSFSQSPATQPFLPGACSTRSISSGISHDPKSAILATCKRGWAPRRPDRKKQLEGRASSCPGPPTALQRLPFRPFHSLSRKTHFENGGPGRSPYSPNRSRRSVTLHGWLTCQLGKSSPAAVHTPNKRAIENRRNRRSFRREHPCRSRSRHHVNAATPDARRPPGNQ